MGEMSGYWKDVSQLKKQQHRERVAKTPNRIEWCQDQFKKQKLPFVLKNEETGQFNAKKGKSTIIYYCSTGTVMLDGKTLNGRGFRYATNTYRNLKEEQEND